MTCFLTQKVGNTWHGNALCTLVETTYHRLLVEKIDDTKQLGLHDGWKREGPDALGDLVPRVDYRR